MNEEQFRDFIKQLQQASFPEQDDIINEENYIYIPAIEILIDKEDRTITFT